MITFALFFLLFTIMLVAEINIMRKAIKQALISTKPHEVI